MTAPGPRRAAATTLLLRATSASGVRAAAAFPRESPGPHHAVSPSIRQLRKHRTISVALELDELPTRAGAEAGRQGNGRHCRPASTLRESSAAGREPGVIVWNGCAHPLPGESSNSPPAGACGRPAGPVRRAPSRSGRTRPQTLRHRSRRFAQRVHRLARWPKNGRAEQIFSEGLVPLTTPDGIQGIDAEAADAPRLLELGYTLRNQPDSDPRFRTRSA